jgi:hypothetical protein
MNNEEEPINKKLILHFKPPKATLDGITFLIDGLQHPGALKVVCFITNINLGKTSFLKKGLRR